MGVLKSSYLLSRVSISCKNKKQITCKENPRFTDFAHHVVFSKLCIWNASVVEFHGGLHQSAPIFGFVVQHFNQTGHCG